MKRVALVLSMCAFSSLIACGSDTPSNDGSGDNDQTDDNAPTDNNTPTDNNAPTDSVAPGPGTAITGQALDTHTIVLEWGAATDDVSTQDTLGYRVVYALAGATITSIDAVGVTAANPDWQALDLTTSIVIANLTPNTAYVFAVFVRDEAHNIAEYPLFTLATPPVPVPDTTPPYVLSTTPSSGSTLNATTTITIVFSESMDTTSSALSGDLGLVSDGGVFSTTTAANDTLTIGPAATWSDGTALTLIVDGTDVAGNPLATVTDLYDVDTALPPAPTVVSVVPADSSVIANDTPIVIVFDQSMSTTSQSLGGLMTTEGDTGTWSTTTLANDTLTIVPSVRWYGGAMTLTVTASNTFATALAAPLSLSYSGPVSPFIADYTIVAGSSPFMSVGPNDVVYLAGSTFSNPGDGQYDHWRVTRLDVAGRVQWNKTINVGVNNRPNGLTATTDGGFLLVGNLPSGLWIGRFNGDAQTVWAYTYDWTASSNERALAVTEVFDADHAQNGFIIAGDGDGNGHLLRIDDLGAVLWWQAYALQPTGGQASLQWVTPLADGGFLAGDAVFTPTSTLAGLVMRTAADGSVTWAQMLATDGAFDIVEHGVELTDGRIALVSRMLPGDGSCNLQMHVVAGSTGAQSWAVEYPSAALNSFRMVATADSSFVVGGPMLLASSFPDGVLFKRTDDGAGGFDEAFQRRYGSEISGSGGPEYGVALAANGDFYTAAGDYNELDRIGADGDLWDSDIATSYPSSATFALPQTTTALTSTITAALAADITQTSAPLPTSDVGVTGFYKVR